MISILNFHELKFGTLFNLFMYDIGSSLVILTKLYKKLDHIWTKPNKKTKKKNQNFI
jgi:hypothetical protein